MQYNQQMFVLHTVNQTKRVTFKQIEQLTIKLKIIIIYINVHTQTTKNTYFAYQLS